MANIIHTLGSPISYDCCSLYNRHVDKHGRHDIGCAGTVGTDNDISGDSSGRGSESSGDVVSGPGRTDSSGSGDKLCSGSSSRNGVGTSSSRSATSRTSDQSSCVHWSAHCGAA